MPGKSKYTDKLKKVKENKNILFDSTIGFYEKIERNNEGRKIAQFDVNIFFFYY